MSINPFPRTQKKFQMYRKILSKMKNNGNADSTILVSHEEVMVFLMSNSPIDKIVEEQMKKEDDDMKKVMDDVKKLGEGSI